MNKFTSQIGQSSQFDHDMFAFFRELHTTTPADVRMKCTPSVATQEVSVLR